MDLKSYSVTPLERTRNIADYLHDIKQYPVLTEAEENELITKIKNGDEKSREKLINCNLRFVFAIAKCYATDDKLLDLVNEGNIGLITAIDMYDTNFKNRFLSYAVWYIRRSINSYLINDNLLVRRTNNAKVSTKLHNINNKYFCENGRYPSEEEIISILRNEYGVKIQLESDLYELKTESINSTFDDDDSNTYENSKEYIAKTSSVNEYEKTIDEDYNKYLAEKMLSIFNERDRQIMEMYFGFGEYKDRKFENFYDIGQEVNLSSERIRQIVSNCIKKMKSAAVMMNK